MVGLKLFHVPESAFISAVLTFQSNKDYVDKKYPGGIHPSSKFSRKVHVAKVYWVI